MKHDRVRPVIRQFGSKNRVAPQIISLLPADARTWVEVFCGTAAVTLGLDPLRFRDEHLNDLNGDIVGLYRVLRDPARRGQLCDLVDFTPWSEAEYKRARAEPHTGDPVEDALRYLLRSWQGMAGSSMRWTSWVSIDTSTKRRTKQWDELPDRLRAVADRFKLVVLHEKPALKMLDQFGTYENAVLFCDPPYPTSAINTRDAYVVSMTDADHLEFAEALRSCAASVVMTMAKGTLYDELLKDWHHLPLYVHGLQNTRKEERIFFNYDPRRSGLFAGL